MSNYREQYKCLLSEYERLGGNLQGVPRFYSLENEAKLKAKLKSLTPRSPLRKRGGQSENRQQTRCSLFTFLCSLNLRLSPSPAPRIPRQEKPVAKSLLAQAKP